MYYEMRTYGIQVGKMDEYLALVEKVGLPILQRYQKLVGWWRSEHGELNQVVHMWVWKSLDERIQQRTALYKDQEWLTNFTPKAFPLIVRQESKLLVATSFSPLA
ncbi:MAG: NIPSNAP family protein [Hyphomicrobiales bacterium]|nr:NIPSNAP family protein [Hyphomicrobiales bacterium]